VGCQRTVLTDQALVAVALARAHAAGTARTPHVADLLVGLAAEPDGLAGRLLREREGAAIRLRERGALPRLAPLSVATGWAADDARPRAATTLDLLRAALEAGGGELRDLLDAVGLGDLAAPVIPPEQAGETLGLRPPTDPEPGLSAEAALAIARTRALAGGAADLLLAIGRGPQADSVAPLPDLTGAVARGDDAGLDAVVGAARAWRGDEPVTTGDLVRAALAVGGDGPRSLLA
jgi:hypothetical protein